MVVTQKTPDEIEYDYVCDLVKKYSKGEYFVIQSLDGGRMVIVHHNQEGKTIYETLNIKTAKIKYERVREAYWVHTGFYIFGLAVAIALAAYLLWPIINSPR